MARRQVPPEWPRVWAALRPEEREVVRTWCAVLDLPPDAWHRVPPLRTLLPMVAAFRLSDGIEGTRADALRDASRALGMIDNGRGSHPAESLERQARSWRSNARGGDFRRSADEGAA